MYSEKRGIETAMDMKEQLVKEKGQFYSELFKRADNKKIIIYGASVIARDVLREICKTVGREVWACCVTKKEVNRKEIEGVPVLQVDEIPPAIYKNALFVIAMKVSNQKEVHKILKEKDITDYMDVPANLCIPDVNQQRIFIPGMEITTKIGCSVNCRYCPQDVLCRTYSDRHKDNLLSLDNFKICLNKMPEDILILFSGFVEPFLNPQCIDMIEYSVQQGHRTLLNTTLVGMSLEDAHRLVELPMGMVTLHTPDKDGYATIPMTEEYFEVLDFLLESRKGDNSPFLDTANCQSVPHPEIVKFINNRISFANLVLIDRAGNLSGSEVDENICHEGDIICKRSVSLNRNVLLPDGTVVLCCMDFGLEHELGNLLYDSYEDIISGQMMKVIRQNMADGGEVLCRRCSFAQRK